MTHIKKNTVAAYENRSHMSLNTSVNNITKEHATVKSVVLLRAQH